MGVPEGGAECDVAKSSAPSLRLANPTERSCRLPLQGITGDTPTGLEGIAPEPNKGYSRNKCPFKHFILGFYLLFLILKLVSKCRVSDMEAVTPGHL